MFWFAAAWATGFSGPAKMYLTDDACNAVHTPSPGTPLRFVFSRLDSTSPPGGPVSRWLHTFGPSEIRLRREQCGAESGVWRALRRKCDGAAVLEWTGPVHPGQSYRIETASHDGDGFRALHTFRSSGRKSIPCAVAPFEPYDDGHRVEVKTTVDLPKGAFTVVRGSTVIEPVLQIALLGGVQGSVVPGAEGVPTTTPSGGMKGQWTETVVVHRYAQNRFEGPEACRVRQKRTATLEVKGVSPFSIELAEAQEEHDARCQALPKLSEESLRSEVEARLARVVDGFEAPLSCQTHPSAVRCLANDGPLKPQGFRRLLDDLSPDLPLEDLRGLVTLSGPRTFDDVEAFLHEKRPSKRTDATASALSLLAYRRLQASAAYREDPIGALATAFESIPLATEPEALADMARRKLEVNLPNEAFFYATTVYQTRIDTSAAGSLPSLEFILQVASVRAEACRTTPPTDPVEQRGCTLGAQSAQEFLTLWRQTVPGDPLR